MIEKNDLVLTSCDRKEGARCLRIVIDRDETEALISNECLTPCICYLGRAIMGTRRKDTLLWKNVRGIEVIVR